MEILPPKKIKIANTDGMGRGVFATENIKKDEIIEYCPILQLSKTEANFIVEKSDILKFYYLFQYEIDKYCLMFGYGSLYNHGNNPNVDIDYDVKNHQDYILFTATKDINAGDEIIYDYEFDKGKEEFLNPVYAKK